ncbi:MAG: hypothetical protein M3548_10915 [Actinomycetota bacterium]|nr:hypothetical protein [Actinomycetota bacterium]
MTEADVRSRKLAWLADQPGAVRPGGRYDAIVDRALVYARPDQVPAVLPYLSDDRGGLVLAGARALTRVRMLREKGYDDPILIDPASYEKRYATPEQPFILPTGQLEPTPLNDLLDQQRLAGATLAPTPTGYIRAGDVESLRAAVRQVVELGRDDHILVAPLDVSLVDRAFYTQTRAILAAARCPVALVLGKQFDPLDQAPTRLIPNLRDLAASIPLMPIRTDFNALDLLAHGAIAGAIGTGGSVRHTVDPAERPKSFNGNKDQSPSVLFPELASWWRGSKISKLYGARPAQETRCFCPVCGGQRLTRFQRRSDQNESMAHAIVVWSGWAGDLLAAPTMLGRAQYWRTFCSGALRYHGMIPEQLGQMEPLKPQHSLKQWATMPIWPVTVPASVP